MQMQALKKFMAHRQARSGDAKIHKDEADMIEGGEGEHHDMVNLRQELRERSHSPGLPETHEQADEIHGGGHGYGQMREDGHGLFDEDDEY
jgi:hypothetical protein